MSQIEIRILKQGTETKKVISCSFFTMKDAYRQKERYISNLQLFCVSTKKPGFCCRIYTDDSGKDDALIISEKYPHVSVYHFNCPEFREEVGHVGTFGTVVRFLPLFEEGLEIVWVSDIDVPSVYLHTDQIESLKKYKCDIYYRTFLCYERKLYGRKYTILAGTILSRVQFPKQLLTRFLNTIKDGKQKDIIDKLNSENSRKPPSEFPYGLDEVFTNSSFYNYIVRHNFKCLIHKDYARAGMYLNYKGLVTKEEEELFHKHYIMPSHVGIINKLKRILVERLPKIITPETNCLQEALDLMPTFKTSLSKLYVAKGKELE